MIYSSFSQISVGGIPEAGCGVKSSLVPESISDEDLCHVFDKADRDKDNKFSVVDVILLETTLPDPYNVTKNTLIFVTIMPRHNTLRILSNRNQYLT